MTGAFDRIAPNGQAIYGTTAGPIQEADRVSTQKDGKVYVFKLENGKFPVLEP